MDGGRRGEEGGASHLLAHALLGAAVATTNGNSALVGSIAAAGAEAAAPALAKLLYGKGSGDLSAAEKSTISAIVGFGGAAIGSFESDMVAAVAGSSAAQNAVDNNWGEVGHYSTMATILYLAGFSEKDAKAIALAAWAPDTDNRNAITAVNIAGSALPGMPQQHNHLLDGESDPAVVKATQEYWTDQVGGILRTIRTLENDPAGKAALLSSAEVQRALHALGDSFAHVKPDGTHFDSGYGHLVPSVRGSDPDNPYTNKEAFREYAIAIYNAGVASAAGTARRDSDTLVTSHRGLFPMSPKLPRRIS